MVNDFLPFFDGAFGLFEEVLGFEYFHDFCFVPFQLITLLAYVRKDLRVHFKADLLLPAILAVKILLANQPL